MSDALDTLQHKLEVAQRELVEAQTRYVRQETEHRTALEEAESVHKQFEAAHREWMNAVDVVKDPIFVHDKDYRILRCNKTYQRSAGIPFGQIYGEPYYEVFPKMRAPLPNCQHAMESGEEEDDDEEEVTIGNSTYRSRAYSVSDGYGAYLYSVHILEDVNGNLRANLALTTSERKYRRLFEAAKDGILILDADSGKIIDANPYILNLLSYSFNECTAKMLWEIGLFKDITSNKAAFRELQDKGCIRYEDLALETKDGRQINVEFISTRYELGEHKLIQCIIRDTTDRVGARQLLQESEQQYRQLFESAKDGILILDAETGKITDANPFILNLLSYRLDESVGKMLWEVGLFRDIAFNKAAFQELQDKGYVRYENMPLETKDGQKREVEFVSNLYAVGDHKVIQCNIRDITERKKSEMKLHRANRALQTLSAGSLALVREENEDELLKSITAVIVEDGGYSLAVIDYAEDDTERSITPMAWSGAQGSHYWAEKLSWAETERGQLPVSKAIRSGVIQVCHDVAADPSFDPWREAVQARGYMANIALPLRDQVKTFGALTIYSSDADAFDVEEIPLLEKLANELAYGIGTLRARKVQEQHTNTLRQSLEQSIQTIADTVQARDPYTAGHQRRVADLAVAIAGEMGLPEDQINGIYLAGIIHDLGKIRIPAEILSRPGHLTDLEFELVKQHPRAGYDIIKNVKFPWPIANIVLQHHERLDGSGYPQGLKADAILLEAKIMTVADVVEAMSSHRPYRPSRGIEEALGEISEMRGEYYDPQVVDACLSLFHDKKYVMSD